VKIKEKQEAEVFMRYLLATVIIVWAFGYDAAAAVNSAVQSPIGSPTAVPSSGKSGLVTSQPSTYGVSGNMIMTGNVGGGKQFRGVVPYSSSFYSRTSSSSVDSFIRRSSGDPLATDRNPGVYTPYYDPRRTATTMYRGGQTGLVAPQSIPQGKPSAVIPSGLPQLNNTPYSLQQRPLSTSPMDISQMMNRQVLPDRPQDVTRDKNNIHLLPPEIKKDTQYDPANPENTLLPEEATKPKPIEGLEDKKEAIKEPTPNRFKEIRDQIQKETEQKETEAAADKAKQENEKSVDKKSTEKTGDSELGGQYKTFADLSEAKATAYMKEAQDFLQNGKFYKAADSFALAAVWKPENANAWIGQVGSLFAAGEYMSSAFYLEQVLTSKPELVKQKIPQAILMQKRDTFESGLLETQTWQERSQSGELAFLMAYMLMQDGKMDRAQAAITRAETLVPDSAAIKNLSQIINSQLLTPQSLPASLTLPVKNNVKEPNKP
jgi:thioredoxin-like negative regulator of GroEL